MRTCLHFCMFDWTGKNEDKSWKSQGILISCVSGNPAMSECDSSNHPVSVVIVNFFTFTTSSPKPLHGVASNSIWMFRS